MNELMDTLGIDWRAAALIASAMVCVSLLIFMIGSATNRARRHYENRLKRASIRPGNSASAIAATDLRRDASASSADRLVARFIPRPENLRMRMVKAGLSIGIGHYAMMMAGCGVVGGAVLYALAGLPDSVSVLLGIALGVAIPHFLVGHLIGRRQARFTKEFPEGIDVIVRGLRAGLPVSESVVAVGRELSGPVREIFADITERLTLGDSVDKAVEQVADRIDTPEIKFFGISLSIQRETGGNLAETLSNLSEILRRRRQMKLKIKAISAEARASAYILCALPFVMFGLLYFVNNEYVMQLFIDPRGMILLGGGLAMMVCGAFVMSRMVSFEI